LSIYSDFDMFKNTYTGLDNFIFRSNLSDAILEESDKNNILK